MNLKSLIQETSEPTKSQLIIILDGVGEGLNHALQELNSIVAAGISSQIVLTKSVDSTKLDLDGLIISPEAIVQLAQDCLIYIPYLSLGLTGKIINLVEDEAAVRILTRGVIAQQKIFIGRSESELLLGGKHRLAFGLRQRIKEYQRLLKSYGFLVVEDRDQILQIVLSDTSESQSNRVSCDDDSTDSLADDPSVSLPLVSSKIAAMIDHTQLKPNTTEADITKLCTEAKTYHFASVCVNPSYVQLAAKLLYGSGVKVCTVIGFPLGANTSTTKALETQEAIANGATEIDMVINVGALKSGNNALVKKDIQAVVAAAKGQAIVKVILETSLLTAEEKVRACLLSKYADADFVKTATGFGPGGATVEDIALMRRTVGAEIGVKASGGIRDIKAAQTMIAAGANRIGASASVNIVKGTQSDRSVY